MTSAYPFPSVALMDIFAAADAGVPLGHASHDLVAVSLDRIVPCRWQPRQQFDPAALLDLANDIAQHGILTPPLVWQNEDMEYELIAGERRIRACWALCLDALGLINPLPKAIAHLAEHSFAQLHADIRARIAGAPSTPSTPSTVHCRPIWGTVAQLHELALVDNLQRADLTPLEEAHALHDLIQEYSYTQRDLAGRLGKSQTWISQRLNLLALAPAVADQVISGELDSATAREIARLDPAVQPEAVAHLQAHGIKSKAAANLVGNLLELSDPTAWASDGGIHHAYDVVIQNKLEQAAPVERQRALLRMAAANGDGRLARPHDSYYYDRMLVAVGAAETPYQAVQKAFATTAADLGRTCATCQLDVRRPQVIEVQEMSRAAGNLDQAETTSWPHCGLGETRTCPAHRTAGERLSLHVPHDSRITLSPEEDARIVKTSDWYQTTDDFEIWYNVTRRKFRFEIAAAEARKDEKDNGLARALAGYIAAQPQIATDHVYSQPCAHCAFHKRDAEDPTQSCQHQAQPPELKGSWGPETLAATWQAEGLAHLVGRCKLFRLKQIGLLPELAGKVAIGRSGITNLLYRLSPRTNYQDNQRSGPRWLDVHRSQAINAPPWGECEKALKKLLPLLTAGQLYALLVAWTDVLPPDAASAQQTVYDPHTDREIVFQRVAKFEAAR